MEIKLSWCRKVTRWQNCQYLSMFYLRPHTSDIRVFCLHFRGFILRHYQLRYKTFVTLGISTSVIISDLEPIASAIMSFQRSFFHSENFQMVTVKFPLKWIAYLCLHMRTRYSESQAVALLVSNMIKIMKNSFTKWDFQSVSYQLHTLSTYVAECSHD